MASIKVSELPRVTAITPDDVLIINDEDLTTSKIDITNFTSSFTGQNLQFSGNTSFIAPTTFSANALPTFNADVVFNNNVTFNGTIVGAGEEINLGQLKDVTFPENITDGFVVTWDATTSKWGAEQTGVRPLIDDPTPQLGGNLDVNGYEIVGGAGSAGTTGKNIVLAPNTDGIVIVKGYEAGQIDGSITLNCYKNTHGVKIQSPPHETAATYTLILPNNMGTSGQVLSTNGTSSTSWITLTPQDINAATAAQGVLADSAMQVNKNNQIPGSYANDAEAANNGVNTGGLYHTSGTVKVRLT